MRITFALPMAGIAGGVKVVFQRADFLRSCGHDVRIVYPAVLAPRSGARWRVEAALRSAKYRTEAARGRSEAREWFPLQSRITHVPSLEPRYLPRADVVVATGVDTAAWIAQLPADRGRKIYFIQDVEDWDVGEAAALATWRLPFARRLVVSRRLAEVASEQGVHVDAVVPNGIDPEQFYPPPGARDAGRTRLLALWHRDSRKGLADWIAALPRIRAVYPDVQPVFFGAVAPPPGALPPDVEFHLRPAPRELRELFWGAAVFVGPSRREGFGLTPLEAMACGNAVVTTAVGAVPDYAVHGRDALLVPPQAPEALARAVLAVLQDDALRCALGRAAACRAREFDLKATNEGFAQALLSGA